MDKGKLHPQERLSKVLDYVKEHSSARVEELAAYFSVTPATIRSDLRELARRDLVSRNHGGASVRDPLNGTLGWRDPSYLSRSLQNQVYKERIGRKVASLVKDGDSIMLDDGSTNLQIARFLPTGMNITVITNGLNICLELSEHPNVEVIELGGILNKTDLSYYGKITEEMVCRFNTNMVILGASAITPDKGLMAPDEHKAGLKKQMMSQTQRLIIAADYTKLTRISMIPVCPADAIHTLVTNEEAPPEVVAEFTRQNVQVLLA